MAHRLNASRFLRYGARLLSIITFAAWLISLPFSYGLHYDDWAIDCRDGHAFAWYAIGHGRELRSSTEPFLPALRTDWQTEWSGLGFAWPSYERIGSVRYVVFPFWLPFALSIIADQCMTRRWRTVAQKEKVITPGVLLQRSRTRIAAAVLSTVGALILLIPWWYSVRNRVTYDGQHVEMDIHAGIIALDVVAPPEQQLLSCSIASRDYGVSRRSRILAGMGAAPYSTSEPSDDGTDRRTFIARWNIKVETQIATSLISRFGLVPPSGTTVQPALSSFSMSAPLVIPRKVLYAFRLPLWLPVCFLLFASLIIWRPLGFGFPPGHCGACGYNLTANTSGICPECGIHLSARPQPAIA